MVNRADLYSISMIASNMLDLVEEHGAVLDMSVLQSLSNLPMSVVLNKDGSLNAASHRKVSKLFTDGVSTLRDFNKNNVYSKTGVWLCNQTMSHKNKLLHKLQHHI